ncbi:MAG: hypothetical protein IJQ90_00280 [Alphaproteobacteria bacterium]|nr:hypothetical protein [Alphaproteobacteria bacterium]
MKKFGIIICGIFMIFSAFAMGENVPTSKNYVDTAVAVKQDKILANDGTAQVLTNTGTAGEVGTKEIYDSTGSYLAQTDALIDAVTMNTAVQNAINSEFQCIEYNPNDPTDCWIMDIFGETGQSILPSGYTALEYIAGTGTQYIDTGVIPDNLTGIDIKFNKSATGDQVVFGILSSVTTQQLYINPVGGSIYLPFAEKYNQASAGIPFSNNLDFDVKINYLNDRKRYVNARKAPDINKTLISPEYTMYLFAGHSAGGAARWFFNGKVYYLKITNGATITHDFVPARRDSDDKIGMYDMVSGTFFTNSGSGEFIAGPVVNLYVPSN